MGILGHKNGKPAKSKRAAKKTAAASSRAGDADPRPGTAKEPPATKAVKPATGTAPTQGKRPRAGRAPSGAAATVADKQVEPPKLGPPSGPATVSPPLSGAAAAPVSRNPAGVAPAGPALPTSANPHSASPHSASPLPANPFPGARRRTSERAGAAPGHGDAKRTGSDARGDSGDSGETPPRANKLMPTNAVHPTERRIKRRMHKNGALMAAAGAALLGVLILSNQSEPPELVLSDRQIASRLPAGQDWQSDAPPETTSETASRRPAADSDSPPARPHSTVDNPQLAAQDQAQTHMDALNTGDIVEMERLLTRLDLAVGTPDGVIDEDTTQAIRLYQEIAGLPVDGKVSQDLLADMREVVKILDGTN